MSQTILAKTAWHDGAFRADMILEIADGVLRAIRPTHAGETVDRTVRLAGPALTDLQVNGSGGVMLNSDPSAEAIATIVATQRARGTGWVMPTLITCEAERLARCVDAAIEAWGLPGFLGVHVEGPHLNPARKGTHDAAHIRPFEPATLDQMRRLRDAGIPVMLTLAPECVPEGTIATLAELGVTVSAGHSAASAAQTETALAEGLHCFTHLYNAMPAMESRKPGILGTALASDAYAGIIVDGHHVAFPMVGIACRARPRAGRTFLVSDAMATIGGPDHFELYGQRITLRDGALVNTDGALAGAHVDLVTCLRNTVTEVGLPLEEAYAMAALVPRDAMGLPRPALAPGTPVEEILCLDATLERLPL